ncbi:hypothetical protein ACQJBY_044924 [Aegilops geniculata]
MAAEVVALSLASRLPPLSSRPASSSRAHCAVRPARSPRALTVTTCNSGRRRQVLLLRPRATEQQGQVQQQEDEVGRQRAPLLQHRRQEEETIGEMEQEFLRALLLGRALVATAMGEGSGEWWRRQTRKRERDVKRNGTVNQDRWNARGGAVVVTHRCCVSGIQLQQDRPAHLLAIHSRREDAEQSRAWPAVEALVPLNGSTVWCGGEEDGDGGCRGGCWRR